MKRFMPFTGRQREIDLFEELLEDALEYSGSTVFLRGEIGVGKTRLLDQFSRLAGNRGFHLLRGRSAEYPTRTYSSISTMVEEFLCHGNQTSQWMARFVTPEMAAHLMNLMPALRELYPVEVQESVHSDTANITLAFLEFFRRLSRSKPLAILLDDIQWMSDESLDLLRGLVDRISDLPVLLIAGIRSSVENPALERITEDLAARRLVEIIQLENLSSGEVSDLVDRKLNCVPKAHFKEWLANITRGNPLFIEEILKALIRQNIIHFAEDADHWTVDDDYMDFSISKTVESVVHYRLSKLGPEPIRALECAAVIGDRFDIGTLGELLDCDMSSGGMQPVNILVSLGMLDINGDRLSFSHPLIRQVLYRSMDRDSRRELHRRLASIMEGKPGHESDIALHLTRDLLTAEETAEMALHLFSIAMELKYAALDHRRSWDCLREALRIAEHTEVCETELLKMKAELNLISCTQGRETLDLPQTRQLLQELITHDLREEALSTYHILFHTALGSLDLEYAEECLERGIELATERNGAYWNFVAEKPLLLRRKGLLDDSLEASLALMEEIPVQVAPEALYRVQTNMGLVCFLKGEQNTAEIHLRRARDTVQDYGLLQNSAKSRLNLALALMTTGDLDSALTEIKESMKEAELMSRKPLVAIGYLYMGTCFLRKGDITRAIRCREEVSRLASETDVSRLRIDSMLMSIKIHLRLGDIARAREILDLIESCEDPRYLRGNFLILKARVTLAENRLDEANEAIDSAISITGSSDLGTRHGTAVGVKGLIQLREGRKEDALKSLSRSRSLLLDKGEVPMMCGILVHFGMELGGSRGEEILIEGVELLKRMKALQSIEALRREISERRGEFSTALAITEEYAEQPEEALIEVLTFGGLSLRLPEELQEGPLKELGSSKSRELLALLLICDTSGVTRDSLISHMWPESPEDKALASLRVALTHLRKAVGSDAIIQDGPYLFLNRDLVHADLWEFNALVEEWRAYIRSGMDHAAENRAGRAMELFRGDFLPEFYTTLLEDEQFRLRNVMRELLLWMAERNLDRMECTDAVRYARKLLAMDPCSEKACRMIMKGLAAMGDRAAAVRQYHRLVKSLTTEFDTMPDRETVELHEQILASE